MKSWVSFALDHLERNDKPVVLHTLPLVQTTNETEKTQGALSNATTVIPRLVSVVEIIKREYLKSLELKQSTRLTGLHQYNELGCLEDLEAEDNRMEQDTPQAANEEARVQNIVQALGGENHVRQKQTPFMRITLSTQSLPELKERGATYQPPLIRKLSKSAKARAKKREKKALEVTDLEKDG